MLRNLKAKKFENSTFIFTFALGIGLWCNGSTTDFGSACPSSNLGKPTNISFAALKPDERSPGRLDKTRFAIPQYRANP